MVAGQAVPEVPATEVPDGAWVLDVREPDEWAAGHIPTATHIPLGQLAQRSAEVPQDETVYVLCRAGGRATRAVQALNGAGWTAVNVEGGMQSWAAAARPMVCDHGSGPSVL